MNSKLEPDGANRVEEAVREVFHTPQPDHRFVDSLEQRLMVKATGMQKVRQDTRPAGLFRTALRAAAWFSACAALAMALWWGFTYLLPRPQTASFQPGTVETQAAPGTVVTETSKVTPTLPVETPPSQQLLRLDSPHELIRMSLYQPEWVTLRADGQVTDFAEDGSRRVTFGQVWLDRNGSGRVLLSDSLAPEATFTLDLNPRWVWISSDAGLSVYDTVAGQTDLTAAEISWTEHPLENAGSLSQMFFPSYLGILSSDVQPITNTIQAGRPALLVRWGAWRMWADAETGTILRLQTLGEGERVVQDIQITAIRFNEPIPVSRLSPEYPDTARFQPDLITFVEPETPADSAVLPGESVHLTLRSEGPATGEQVYFVLRAIPGFGRLVRVRADCLLMEPSCEMQPVPGYPDTAPQLLSWSPDSKVALFQDEHTQRLMSYVVEGDRWNTVAEKFFLSTYSVPWSPDGAWFAASVQSGEDGDTNLVTLLRLDGSESHTITNTRGSMDSPIAWLDENTLLVQHTVNTPKGADAPPETPLYPNGFYQVDVDTGTWIVFGQEIGGVKNFPALSPDGERLAITGASGELAILNTVDGSLQSLGISSIHPIWSPDGQWIAAVQPEESGWQLWAVQADGSEQRLLRQQSEYPNVVWSTDNAHLLASTMEGTAQDEWRWLLVSLADGSVRNLVVDVPGRTYQLFSPSWPFTGSE